jgi:diacylglycerol diphosphate phosphatase / phosphatidate phosphatase
VGRLRPDFISRCAPDPKYLPSSVICTGAPKLVAEGRRSFPSGHSSSVFGGMSFISLLLTDHFLVFDGSGRIYKFLIFLIPLLTACLVSISRIVDYRHHWDDVLVGSSIGCVSAASGYYYFYPLIFKNIDFNQAQDENVNNQLQIMTSESSV